MGFVSLGANLGGNMSVLPQCLIIIARMAAKKFMRDDARREGVFHIYVMTYCILMLAHALIGQPGTKLLFSSIFFFFSNLLLLLLLL